MHLRSEGHGSVRSDVEWLSEGTSRGPRLHEGVNQMSAEGARRCHRCMKSRREPQERQVVLGTAEARGQSWETTPQAPTRVAYRSRENIYRPRAYLTHGVILNLTSSHRRSRGSMVDIRENCYERQERSSDKLIDMVTQSNVLASLEIECESQGLTRRDC